ncbi:hypothetical protein [Tenacibaculum agarivorans]|nr:hypothetical protein [Tenacibaculum agarivorans]
MNRVIIITLLSITIQLNAQEAYTKLPSAKEQNPVVIFNQKINR